MKARPIYAVTLALLMLTGSGQLWAMDKTEARKDPKTAMSWGYLLPGAGHIYAGEAGKGWLLMATSVGALTAGAIITLNSGDEDAEVGYDYDFSKGQTNWTPSYIGLGVFSIGWLYSVVDAPKAAERTNRKRGLSSLPVRLDPYMMACGRGAEYGLRLRVEL